MSLITNLIDKVTELVKLKIDQLKLELKGQATVVLSKLIVVAIIGMLITFSIFFLGLGLAFYWNSVWESDFLGFVVVGSIALVLSIILIRFAKSEAFTRVIKNSLLEND